MQTQEVFFPKKSQPKFTRRPIGYAYFGSVERGSGDGVFDETLRSAVQQKTWDAVADVSSAYGGRRISQVGVMVTRGYYPDGFLHFSYDLKSYASFLLRMLSAESLNVTSKSNENQAYAELYKQYRKVVKQSGGTVGVFQKSRFLDILRKLSRVPNMLDLNPIVKISADNELLVVRGTASGNVYLIVGEDPDDITFGFAGFKRGDYKSEHYEQGKNTVDSLIAAFIKE